MIGEHLPVTPRRGCGALAAVALGLGLSGCNQLQVRPANDCQMESRVDKDITTILRLPEQTVVGVTYDPDAEQVAVHGYTGDVDRFTRYDLSSGAETLTLTDNAGIPNVYFVVEDDTITARCVGD